MRAGGRAQAHVYTELQGSTREVRHDKQDILKVSVSEPASIVE